MHDFAPLQSIQFLCFKKKLYVKKKLIEHFEAKQSYPELWAASEVTLNEEPVTELILQLFRRFTYVTAHSPTIPSLYLRHSSFSNPSVTSPTSQLILQPLFRFSYVTGSSLTSPGEPPMRPEQLYEAWVS